MTRVTMTRVPNIQVFVAVAPLHKDPVVPQ